MPKCALIDAYRAVPVKFCSFLLGAQKLTNFVPYPPCTEYAVVFARRDTSWRGRNQSRRVCYNAAQCPLGSCPA